MININRLTVDGKSMNGYVTPSRGMYDAGYAYLNDIRLMWANGMELMNSKVCDTIAVRIMLRKQYRKRWLEFTRECRGCQRTAGHVINTIRGIDDDAR